MNNTKQPLFVYAFYAVCTLSCGLLWLTGCRNKDLSVPAGTAPNGYFEPIKTTVGAGTSVSDTVYPGTYFTVTYRAHAPAGVKKIYIRKNMAVIPYYPQLVSDTVFNITFSDQITKKNEKQDYLVSLIYNNGVVASAIYSIYCMDYADFNDKPALKPFQIIGLSKNTDSIETGTRYTVFAEATGALYFKNVRFERNSVPLPACINYLTDNHVSARNTEANDSPNQTVKYFFSATNNHNNTVSDSITIVSKPHKYVQLNASGPDYRVLYSSNRKKSYTLREAAAKTDSLSFYRDIDFIYSRDSIAGLVSFASPSALPNNIYNRPGLSIQAWNYRTSLYLYRSGLDIGYKFDTVGSQTANYALIWGSRFEVLKGLKAGDVFIYTTNPGVITAVKILSLPARQSDDIKLQIRRY